MADVPRPFEAYRGNGEYVFVSYAHADAATVYPDLAALQDAGFNVWYDEGISPGSRWTSELADAIDGASLVIGFLSPSAVASENCINEIEFAVSRRRPILVVHTEETALPAGLELSLGGRQALMRHRLDLAAYRQRLTESAEKLLAGGDPHIPPPPKKPALPRPMLLSLLVVLAAAAVYFATSLQTPPSSELPLAIAVRPFDTAAADPDSRLFAAGIADDLVMRLDHWRTLPVIARGSSFSADLPTDPIEAG
ncbi:MAG: TIR domain-containing protein, partial [Gammaproteobacteria bacterium]